MPHKPACIIRATGSGSFAIKQDHLPGVIEIRCTTMNIENRREFDRNVRALKVFKGANNNDAATGNDDGSNSQQGPCNTYPAGIPVLVELGPYSLPHNAFVNCSLRHPAPATEVVAVENTDKCEMAEKNPSPCKDNGNDNDK